jgi:hypothetical protein
MTTQDLINLMGHTGDALGDRSPLRELGVELA